MHELEDLAESISIAFGCDYYTTLMQLETIVGKGQKMAYHKSIGEKASANVGNREQRRRFMKQFGLLKGATHKRTASMKVKR